MNECILVVDDDREIVKAIAIPVSYTHLDVYKRQARVLQFHYCMAADISGTACY